jgi:DNA-binding transcriptional ArsR family regulator
MNVAPEHDEMVAKIAAAIGERARARMLYALLDGHARTSTELGVIAEVSPSTASGHLARLKSAKLIGLHIQGKHRYYGLSGRSVAHALEGLSVIAGAAWQPFQTTAPDRLRLARTCYDHIAGAIGVAWLDRLAAMRWIAAGNSGAQRSFELTSRGAKEIRALGMNVEEMLSLRRRFAFPCMDWSERRPHLGGTLGTALLKLALKRRWLEQDSDSRSLRITRIGRTEMSARFGIQLT